MCLVIASLHVYLGMHILEREVIFVDLSLAQLAAFGAMVATSVGHGEHPWTSHLGSLLFTLVGAAIFAFTGKVRNYVSQEAIVGIVYAMASTMMILLLSHSITNIQHT